MRNYVCIGYGKKIEFDKIGAPFNIIKKISVVIPTYNEEENVNRIVNAVKYNLNKTQFKDSYEIIVVDDNSKDKTPEIIDKLAKKNKVIALHRYGKRGLFSAVNDGISVANGKYVLTMDADFSHPPEIIPQIVKNAEKYDAVVASRYIRGGGVKGVNLFRRTGSVVLNLLCVLIAGLPVSDCGGQFRLFNKDKYSKIKYKYGSYFAESGIELFFRAKQLKFRIKEIPFVYEFRERGSSKMGNLKKLPVLGIRYLRTALKLRMEKLRGEV